jgi:hypothetical protein
VLSDEICKNLLDSFCNELDCQNNKTCNLLYPKQPDDQCSYVYNIITNTFCNKTYVNETDLNRAGNDIHEATEVDKIMGRQSDDCNVLNCLNGGKCVYDEVTNKSMCICGADYAGNNCEIKFNEDICATSNLCENNATCRVIKPGDIGNLNNLTGIAESDNVILSKYGMILKENGSNVDWYFSGSDYVTSDNSDNSWSQICVCLEGFTGKYCESKVEHEPVAEITPTGVYI